MVRVELAPRELNTDGVDYHIRGSSELLSQEAVSVYHSHEETKPPRSNGRRPLNRHLCLLSYIWYARTFLGVEGKRELLCTLEKDITQIEQHAGYQSVVESARFKLLYDDNKVLRPDGTIVDLTPVQTGILFMFISNPGKVISQEDFLGALVGKDLIARVNFRQSLAANVQAIRKKLEDGHTQKSIVVGTCIRRIAKQGYVWVAEETQSKVNRYQPEDVENPLDPYKRLLQGLECGRVGMIELQNSENLKVIKYLLREAARVVGLKIKYLRGTLEGIVLFELDQR